MNPAIRDEILAILHGASDMSLATLRGDGYPQATTVSYAHDGLTLYFGCAGDSEKARNLARHDKISLTITCPMPTGGEIRSVSVGGRATLVRDPREAEQAGRLLLRKFPEGIAEYASDGMAGVALFRVTPEVISVLDYRKGFGHIELVSDPGALEEVSRHRRGGRRGVLPGQRSAGIDADHSTVSNRAAGSRILRKA